MWLCRNACGSSTSAATANDAVALGDSRLEATSPQSGLPQAWRRIGGAAAMHVFYRAVVCYRLKVNCLICLRPALNRTYARSTSTKRAKWQSVLRYGQRFLPLHSCSLFSNSLLPIPAFFFQFKVLR